ncbi:MAG: transposase [Desulfobacula sp.]|nr:transposase [Desulfobacula sp.]
MEKTPSGDYVIGGLANKISKSHFGSTLTAFILYQYYHAHVTQPLIFEQLKDYGVDISTGQINRIISENKDMYHKEKDMILSTGLKFSSYINIDDTGARHDGKNGYCTHIGNQFSAWFKSTQSKSRINFLELLRASHCDYAL